MHVPTPRKPRPHRRVDPYRWLRSDGTPNFSDRVFRAEKELHLIARRNPRVVYPSTTLLKALEEMSLYGRSLIVSDSGRRLRGLLTLGDIVSYLGGGEYYRIVAERHAYNIYSALERETVDTIMVKNPIHLYVDDTLTRVLESMIIHGIGVVPVLDRDGAVYGIITEHDLVRYLYGIATTGLKVAEAMSRPVVTIGIDASLKKALEKMTTYGFRRLPVTSGDNVAGMLTAMDVVKYFGDHRALRDAASGDIREVHSKPVEELMSRELVTVKPGDDLATAIQEMMDKDVSSVLVVDDEGVLQGILTERDVLYALTIAGYRSV
ncbi:CBS domain-containing protein [Desulfurococcus mucosus]|uniref:Putative signal transduction protein with CBS domains n=1 Tax=Desulfurococcus mucosus (strain ATCC 35584 / DSM 2162 / JCM 9187 / O7/1) TaxID=765177 RepID=E8R7J4_DESM0|nr:CBS domain-containing protein [Desulfurococcus mucosus]ADV64489.1 putative signal transduction protein with CBS domains [Desulfurococcus mucosus DSM 2162]